MATIVTGGTQKKATAPSALPVNAWTHLAMTYSGARLLLFINGVRSASKSTTGAMPNSTGPLRLGGTAVSSSQWFAGSLDELRVYNRALSESEIQADMNAPVGAHRHAAALDARQSAPDRELGDDGGRGLGPLHRQCRRPGVRGLQVGAVAGHDDGGELER